MSYTVKFGKLTRSTKFNEVSGELANLKGIVSVQEIIDCVLRINNFKSKTMKGMVTNAVYDPNEKGVVPLSELYVDMTYQRIIRLQKIVNKLKKLQGFDMYSAGVIDIAIRPQGDKYVWDGLRRCIMAGLCGLTHIKSSQFIHPMSSTLEDCRMTEARYFKSRNADNENMKAEEIFKSEVVYRDPQALKLLSLIVNCGLDIEGLNPDGRVFGGFVELRDNQNKTEERFWIKASEIIQEVYPKEVVSGYLLSGLSYLLQLNEDVDSSYSDEEIMEAFKIFAKVRKTQSVITKPRANNNARKSIAYIIARRVLEDNNGLVDELVNDLDDEWVELESVA